MLAASEGSTILRPISKADETTTHPSPHAWLCPANFQERRVALGEGRPVPQDLLGVLLTAADDEGRGMTDEELWEDVHDVMGAGG